MGHVSEEKTTGRSVPVVVDRPPLTQLELTLADGTPLLARVTCKSADHLALQPGVSVYAQIKSVAVLP